MTSFQIVQILMALGIGSIATSVIQGLLQRKKVGADYASVIASSATGLLAPLTRRVAELESALENEHRKVIDLTSDLEGARAELRALRRELKEVRAENHREP